MLAKLQKKLLIKFMCQLYMYMCTAWHDITPFKQMRSNKDLKEMCKAYTLQTKLSDEYIETFTLDII
jgi:hypothetical protein